jgi:hypothetical protein
VPVFICFEDDPEDEQLAKDDAKSLAEAVAESGHIVGYALQAKGRLDVRTLAAYSAITKSSLPTKLSKHIENEYGTRMSACRVSLLSYGLVGARGEGTWLDECRTHDRMPVFLIGHGTRPLA